MDVGPTVTDTRGFLDPQTPPQLVLIMTTDKKCGNLIADETSSSLIFHFHPNFGSQVNKVVKLNRRPDEGNLKLKLQNMKSWVLSWKSYARHGVMTGCHNMVMSRHVTRDRHTPIIVTSWTPSNLAPLGPSPASCAEICILCWLVQRILITLFSHGQSGAGWHWDAHMLQGDSKC